MDKHLTYKVFSIGYPRTGTSSLRKALKDMGFKTGGPTDLYNPDVNAHVGDWLCLPNDKYKILDEQFPNAQFIFTERIDAHTWYQSVVRRTSQIKDTPGIRHQRNSMYGNPTPLRYLYVHRYLCRSRDVCSYFMDKYGPDVDKKFLVMCFEDGDGWEKLSAFLGVKSPEGKFPHSNKSKNK